MTDASRLRPHPLNQGYEHTPHAGPLGFLSAEQVRQFDEQGFVVLDDVLDLDELAVLREELDRWEATAESWLRLLGGRVFIARAGEISFAPHLVLLSPLARAFAAGRVFRGVCRDLIGADVRLYWDQIVYKKPGTAKPFPWHQDNGYTYIEPQSYLTCWVPLVDAPVESGCPWVVPGAHRSGTYAHARTDLGFVCFENPPADAVPAPVKAGGMVLFSSLTPHATGPNTTDYVRKAYILQYAPDGARVLDPAGNGRPACHPYRQFPVLENGEAPSRASEPEHLAAFLRTGWTPSYARVLPRFLSFALSQTLGSWDRSGPWLA